MVRRRTSLVDEKEESGVDIKHLNACKKRFLDFNLARLGKMRSIMRKRQLDFLDALPLLLHLNHPVLPGWSGSQTPFGIVDYQPDDTHINAVKKITKSPRLDTYFRECGEILAVYLMGSTGTLAQTDTSDLDVWVVHNANLSDDAAVLLQEKIDKIEQWANENGANVHFFLMSPNYFKSDSGELVHDENCGSAQHYLLLDEFYRTGLLLAGCFPLWWIVPPEHESHYEAYANHLITHRYTVARNAVDFGAIHGIPANEFLGAAMWQLHKAMSDPYKSVIKILLMEYYASVYPDAQPLSLTLKQQVYDAKNSVEQLDPYLIVYRQIESYLSAKNKAVRLSLARRCFYIKIDGKLSIPSKNRQNTWRFEIMQQLVKEWGWKRREIQHLDKRNEWTVIQVMEERQILMNELNSCYHFLSRFASSNQSVAHIRYEDLMLLGRKLFACFERKPGKIERINPGISTSLFQPKLSFKSEENEYGQFIWSLYSFELQGHEAVLLKKSLHLMELVEWAAINGLHDKGTEVQVIEMSNSIVANQLVHLLQFVKNIGQQLLSLDSIDNFRARAQAEECIFIINLGVDPLRDRVQEGFHLVSDKTDALCYGAMKANLVQKVNLVTINSWGEVCVSHFDGQESLLQAVCSCLNLMTPNVSRQPKYHVWCGYSNHSETIKRRVEEFVNDILWSFFDPSYVGVARYLISLGNEYALLESTENNTGYTRHDALEQVWDAVSLPISEFSPLVIDTRADIDDLFRDITNVNKKNVIQLFYRKVSDTLHIIILDERGCIYVTEHSAEHTIERIKHYLAFLEKSLFRRQAEGQAFSIRAIEVIELMWLPKNQQFSMTWHHEFVAESELPGKFIQVIGSWAPYNEVEYAFYFDGKTFNYAQYGHDLYRVVAEFVYKQRASDQPIYPIYISDLDLQCGVSHSNWSTSILMRYKNQIESNLNDALKILLK